MSLVQKGLSKLRVARVRASQPWAWPSDPDVRAEAVVWVHRLLLGRDPTSADEARAIGIASRSIDDVLEKLAPLVESDTVAKLNVAGASFGHHWRWPESQEGRQQACLWAYRLLLEREPENPAVLVEKSRRLAGAKALRGEFLGSQEFRAGNAMSVVPAMSGDEPRQHVDVDVSDEVREALFKRVQSIWQKLGEEEAHWSVATIDDFRPDRIQESLASFFATGERDIATLWRTLARNGVDVASIKSALDFGCGVGRLSLALAKRVSRLEAADVSASHLKLAQEAAAERQQVNIHFHHLQRIDDLAELPKVDLVYSIIVLQHNPPPVMKAVFGHLLGRVAPGGVAVIQVPTYLPEGYEFNADRYTNTHASGMEMHPLPQRVVFQLTKEAGCELLEVLEDAWTGYGHGARSNTFVITRPAH